jgi:uncharacterized damage-inducible protein DinB
VSPQDCKVAAGFYIGDLEGEIPVTVRVLSAVQEAAQNYKPDEKSKTGLGLARHITLEDAWLLESAIKAEMQPLPDDSDVCGLMNGADCAARYGETIPRLVEQVKALTPEQLATQIDFFGMMKLPAVSLVGMAIRHSVHHRGQLSSYLRAMGGKVPGIYGPSADEPMQG